jgi:hypothetical protein
MEGILAEVAEIDDAWEAFRAFVVRSVETMAADRGLAQVLAWRPEAMSEAAQARPDLQQAVEALVERGKKARALRPDIEWWDVPMMMCVLGHAVQAQGPNMNIDRYVTLLLDGVRAKGSTPLPPPTA